MADIYKEIQVFKQAVKDFSQVLDGYKLPKDVAKIKKVLGQLSVLNHSIKIYLLEKEKHLHDFEYDKICVVVTELDLLHHKYFQQLAQKELI